MVNTGEEEINESLILISKKVDKTAKDLERLKKEFKLKLDASTNDSSQNTASTRAPNIWNIKGNTCLATFRVSARNEFFKQLQDLMTKYDVVKLNVVYKK